MPITVATDTQTIESSDEELFQEEDSLYNFRELMDQVSLERDLIFTIPSDEVEKLKEGLIATKGKDNAKLKNAGLLTDNMVLAFLVYPAKDANGVERAGISDLRVTLRNRKSVKVLDIRKPGDL